MLGEAFTVTELPNRAELDLGPALREGTRIGFTVSHIPGIDGESVGAAVFFKDLTRIEHREEKERLRDRLAALGEMAARLAHEVRNPLASIEVTCGLLRRRFADDESARELIDKIRAEVQRLNGTVTSSLEFVKPASSNFGSAELQPLIDEAMTVARDRHDRPEVEIRIGKRVDLPVLRADRDQLRQVFENLVLNAAEAVGDSGQVVIDVERVAAPKTVSASYDEPLRSDDLVTSEFDEFIVVRVSDDGPGIPEQARGRIFHPFFTTKRQGSGVGLSTVKKIVDSHGGLIDVDRSTLGGARFTVRLPLISATLESLEGQQR
jgi:signal transduction histidine kinase